MAQSFVDVAARPSSVVLSPVVNPCSALFTDLVLFSLSCFVFIVRNLSFLHLSIRLVSRLPCESRERCLKGLDCVQGYAPHFMGTSLSAVNLSTSMVDNALFFGSFLTPGQTSPYFGLALSTLSSTTLLSCSLPCIRSNLNHIAQ